MKVVLIDDHTLFRDGLRGLLERRGIDVVSSVGDGESGIQSAFERSPDVILLDLRMPDMTGIDVLARLSAKNLDVPISILTTSPNKDDLAESLRNGARGYLLKDMDPDDLVVALNDIVSGKTIVAPELTSTLAELVQDGLQEVTDGPRGPFSKLTPRELEILCHLSEGQSNKVIARHLMISDGTVKLHVKSILRKLGVHSRVEVAVMAVENDVCGDSSKTPRP
ncbi:MAG: two-component system response regulator NarL [Acidiferrobacteraceae bacterium]|nr:two-component system response regulator NarL [Acidiferrobacteraceae bacterium]